MSDNDEFTPFELGILEVADDKEVFVSETDFLELGWEQETIDEAVASGFVIREANEEHGPQLAPSNALVKRWQRFVECDRQEYVSQIRLENPWLDYDG